MDFLTFGFLVLIVLASGGIAVFADWLGRKLGKKRLTIFRLRPKTTAQLGTFTSGIVISFVTIALVFVISSDVRQWIQEGRRAIGEVVQLQKDKKNLEADVSDLARTERDLRTRATSWQRLADERKRTVALQNATIESQKAMVAQLRKKATGLQSNLRRIQSNYATVQHQLSAAIATLRTAKGQLLTVRLKLGGAQSELRKTNATLKVAVSQNSELAQRTLFLENQAESLEKSVGQLQAQVGSLESQQAKLTQDATEAQEKLDQTRSQLINADIELSQKTADLNNTESKLQAAQNALGVSFTASRIQPLIFSVSEELARLPVPGHLSLDEALNAIHTLERAARSTALERGAKGRGQDYPAAGIFERQDTASQRVFTTEDLEKQLAEKIAGQPQDQLLIAFSSLNVFRGEPVSLEVAVLPNPVVYKQSDVIAESRIDGKKDVGQLWEDITSFIGSKVRDSARGANMIAKRGSAESLGAVPASDLLKLVARVKAMDRTVKLQALAEGDTKAGDPLRLEFRIR